MEFLFFFFFFERDRGTFLVSVVDDDNVGGFLHVRDSNLFWQDPKSFSNWKDCPSVKTLTKPGNEKRRRKKNNISGDPHADVITLLHRPFKSRNNTNKKRKEKTKDSSFLLLLLLLLFFLSPLKQQQYTPIGRCNRFCSTVGVPPYQHLAIWSERHLRNGQTFIFNFFFNISDTWCAGSNSFSSCWSPLMRSFL